ncbi:hypothetical protein G3580_07515 [Nitrogeniibacter mangrovi]|uniref:Uncharacterized protein n=1 Tax=Nitrogeniibacter mangrovi TaxID=2016596 RepID=A0A6C1B2A2_9RHOO|nr:hypothetical protein [Nitrogeniibacter mangrovi]QID17503.1 hypothetical protein G3580_07515 [Nitrogeniibacter mangrovi]
MLRRRDGSTWQHHPDPESGRYAYVPFEYNVEQLLGEWPSEGDTCHIITLWTFQLDGRPTGMDSCRIQVANTAPDYELMLSGTDSTDPDHAEPAIVCTYRARDPWFGSARLELDAAGTREPVTTSNTQTPPRGLDWHLPAGSIDPVRHQLLMTVRNRVIVDSSMTGHQRIERLPFTMERL